MSGRWVTLRRRATGTSRAWRSAEVTIGKESDSQGDAQTAESDTQDIGAQVGAAASDPNGRAQEDRCPGGRDAAAEAAASASSRIEDRSGDDRGARQDRGGGGHGRPQAAAR
jgi:hypothetical protein